MTILYGEDEYVVFQNPDNAEKVQQLKDLLIAMGVNDVTFEASPNTQEPIDL